MRALIDIPRTYVPAEGSWHGRDPWLKLGEGRAVQLVLPRPRRYFDGMEYGPACGSLKELDGEKARLVKTDRQGWATILLENGKEVRVRPWWLKEI